MSSTCGIEGGREAGARVIDALEPVTRVVDIGAARSLATHPATIAHRRLDPAEPAASGASEDTVRLYTGLEHVDDIRVDLERALAAATGCAAVPAGPGRDTRRGPRSRSPAGGR